MMFAARCLGVCLAVFVLLYGVLTVAVSRGWQSAVHALRPSSARGVADLLFALRLFPVMLAAAFTLAVTLPSYLLLEPRSADEAVGTLPTALALCCLLVLSIGCIRAATAQRRSSRMILQWLASSKPLLSDGSVPIFSTAEVAPTFTVAGVRAPRVLVSESVLAALSDSELRSALRHEMAHARRYDNLRKLLFRVLCFPGMSELESAWSVQTEMAADDAAVSCYRDALDLAAALIKVSRLGPLAPCELTTSLLHSSTAISARVRRLFAWAEERGQERPGRSAWYLAPAAAAMVLCFAGLYFPMLSAMHTVTEWLVR